MCGEKISVSERERESRERMRGGNFIIYAYLVVVLIGLGHSAPTEIQQEMMDDIESEVESWCESLIKKDGTMWENAAADGTEKPTCYESKAKCKATTKILQDLVQLCVPVKGAVGNSEAGSEECRSLISTTIDSSIKYGMVLWAGMKAKKIAMKTHLVSKEAYRCLEMLVLGRVMDHLTNDPPTSLGLQSKGSDYRVLPLWGASEEKTGIVGTMWSVLSAKFASGSDPVQVVLAGQSAPRLNSFLWTDEVSELIEHEHPMVIALEWWSNMPKALGASQNWCQAEKADRESKGIPSTGMNCERSCKAFVTEYNCGKGMHVFGGAGTMTQTLSRATEIASRHDGGVASSRKGSVDVLEPDDTISQSRRTRERSGILRSDGRRRNVVHFQSAHFYCRQPEDSSEWMRNIESRARTPIPCQTEPDEVPKDPEDCEHVDYVCLSVHP